MKYIGAHVSAEGGVENAPIRAHEMEPMPCFFYKNQRRWVSPFDNKSIELFKENCENMESERSISSP